MAENQRSIAKSEQLNDIVNCQIERRSEIEKNILIANASEAIALKESLSADEEEINRNEEEIQSTRRYIKKLIDDEQKLRMINESNIENEGYVAREVLIFFLFF